MLLAFFMLDKGIEIVAGLNRADAHTAAQLDAGYAQPHAFRFFEFAVQKAGDYHAL